MISYVVEQALASRLEHLYIWTLPERVEELKDIVNELPGHEKVRKVVPAHDSMFASMTHTIQEYVTADLFHRNRFASWHELLEFTDGIPEARATTVMHISSDAPLIRSREIDEFCDAFDIDTTDYCIGVTRHEHVNDVLARHGLLEEFSGLTSTIKNFTMIAEDTTHAPLSIRINNLHLVKPYLLESAQYDLFGEIFSQRKVSKITRWFKLAALIRSIFQLPWLDDEQGKRELYTTVWQIVRSQERLPAILRKPPSQHTSVRNVEKNISFLLKLRSRIYLDGRFGAFFDADSQEEYDFLRAHWGELSADPDL